MKYDEIKAINSKTFGYAIMICFICSVALIFIPAFYAVGLFFFYASAGALILAVITLTVDKLKKKLRGQ